MSAASTDARVRVIIEIEATCPICDKRLRLRRQLSEEQLSTGNTTQAATFHLREMKTLIQATKDQRGWTIEMCGACRDKDPIEGE